MFLLLDEALACVDAADLLEDFLVDLLELLEEGEALKWELLLGRKLILLCLKQLPLRKGRAHLTQAFEILFAGVPGLMATVGIFGAETASETHEV